MSRSRGISGSLLLRGELFGVSMRPHNTRPAIVNPFLFDSEEVWACLSAAGQDCSIVATSADSSDDTFSRGGSAGPVPDAPPRKGMSQSIGVLAFSFEGASESKLFCPAFADAMDPAS